jgi:hypothetical protein
MRTALADNPPCSNQTNLAIKGIIGLKAMSQIAQLTNNEDRYGEIAHRYLDGWKELRINSQANPPHTTLSYGDNDSHGKHSLPTALPSGLED